MGWLTCLCIAAVLAISAWHAVRLSAYRWFDYFAICVIAAISFVPLYRTVAGDISRVLPAVIWSDGPDGKDQIILTSVTATFLLPVIVAAWFWRGVRIVRTRLRS